MNKKCDECKKDICDCRLSSKQYNRGYQQGRADERRKFAKWCDRKAIDFLDQYCAEEVIEIYEAENNE